MTFWRPRRILIWLTSLFVLACLLSANLPLTHADDTVTKSTNHPVIVRAAPAYGAALVGTIPADAAIVTTSEETADSAGNIWFQVRWGDLSGWAQIDWEPVADVRTTAGTSARGAQRPADNVGDSIAQTALNYVGYSYVFGGASPAGFDCSGLIYYVLAQHGIAIGRSTFSQIGYGQVIDSANVQPGDLVFFANTYTTGISHVGIYIGGGQFVDAESERTGVRINSLSNSYWASHFAGIRRVR